VDHFIKFKGCPCHQHVENNEFGIKDFIQERQGLDIPYPDFAENDRLPKDARIGESDGPDNGQKKSKKPLGSTTTSEEWEEVADMLQRSMTGMDEAGKIKHFSMEKGNLLKDHAQEVRDVAKGKVTVDIDSVLSLFTDLSMINCTIDIGVVWNPWRNLQSSVHIAHKGIPLHRIPHFHLGKFGGELNFDLYVFAPKAYDKNARTRNGVIPNRLREETVAEFMDKCFLKAFHKCVQGPLANRWPSKYEIQKAKSTAPGIEGRIYRESDLTRCMELPVPLHPESIPKVWKKCKKYLAREIQRSNSKLSPLEGMQFFIDAKGTKDRLFTDSIPKVMSIYKDKVVEHQEII